VSEYQYYEFQAIDRPLTEKEMAELRSRSSRATITATRFVNEYHYGNFKGNPSEWMTRYFDAFLYLTNWGTRELMLRLPRRLLDPDTVACYCSGDSVSLRVAGEAVILEICSEWDGDDEEVYEGDGWLSSLIPLRADLVAGDHRALYLAWLFCAQNGDLGADATEPPVPPGLRHLSAPLTALADFLRIDDDLIAVAAERSLEPEVASAEALEPWVRALPEEEKTQWLLRLAGGRETHLRAELLRKFHQAVPGLPRLADEPPRTVGELLGAAEAITAERRRLAKERQAAEAARREREAAEARMLYLSDLAQREAQAWQQVDTLIATKQPGGYDQAVQLLRDLRELGVRDGRQAEVDSQLLRLNLDHAKKPSLMKRLRAAGLI
jgi:hypothetical protein